MKTPYLIHVPKSSPSKRDRLQSFKKEHRIFTHDCREKYLEYRWCAALLNQSLERFGCYCKGEAEADLPDSELFMILLMHACRLMDESCLMVTGANEMQALRLLCEENNIRFPF